MLYFYLFVKKIERIYTFYRVFYHLWSIPIESGDRMSLSKKLSYLKHKEKLTTLEIAQRTSLPVGTLNKIFSGQTLSPSLKIIDRLSTLFHVPSHYLIDDEIPVGCSIGAYVESQGLLMLSEREGELFDLFRQLDEHNKQTIEWITRALARQSSKQKNSLLERRLLCYTPVAWGERGFYMDSLSFRTLSAPVCTITREADYVITVVDTALEPAYSPGTLLAVTHKAAEQNQLGVFSLNQEGFLRKFCCRRGTCKLMSLNTEFKTLTVGAHDEFLCLGKILGAVRNYRWE